MDCTALVAATLGLAVSASAQPALEIRFDNGTSEITVEPGATVRASVYAEGLPPLGSYIPWHTANVPYPVRYWGVNAAYFDILATDGVWTSPTLPSGMGYMGPPFASPGTPTGATVTGVRATVGFNPPIMTPTVLLWQGDLTVGTRDVDLRTEFRDLVPLYWSYPTPLMGIEVAVDWGGSLLEWDVLPAQDAFGVIHVPGPASTALGLAWAVAVSRRPRRPGSPRPIALR